MQREHRWKRNAAVLLIFTLLLIAQTPLFAPFLNIAPLKRVFAGAPYTLNLPTAFRLVSTVPAVVTAVPDARKIVPADAGVAAVDVMLGHVPLSRMNVHVYPDLKVYPGGQSIGVKLRTPGILVVGYKKVSTSEGENVSPAEQAAVKVGDIIRRVDGQELKDAGALTPIVERAGREGRTLNVEIVRGDRTFTVPVKPVLDPQDNTFKLGLFVRDSAAGIGTLTFFDPNTRAYGALGHVISDLDTKRPIAAGGGAILPSTVTAVDRGTPGRPGAIRAVFPDERKKIGDIERNTPFGIFGHLQEVPKHPLYDRPIPVSFAEDVKVGPAKMLTVIDGDRVEAYDIEITAVFHQEVPSTKSMVIRVTDPRLIEKTGGIVQGMSGSPIIQDGRLVGAVTHVFVGDSTQGYGVFIEWMLRMTELMRETSEPNAA